MIYPVYVYGMPVLRKVAQDIHPEFEGLGQLIEDMYETMYQAEGVGLSANQIGITDRILVIDATRVEDQEDEGLKEFKKVFINAYIVEETGEEWEFNEGCLSIPGIREDVKRKQGIRLKYMDEDFNEFEEEFDGYKARILQHELDHLNGILFTDRVSPLRKRLLNASLRKISRGITDVTYKIRYPVKKIKASN